MNVQELFEKARILSTTYLLVDGEVVWDYKIGEKDLLLITSPLKGTPFTEYVSVGELVGYVEKEGRGFSTVDLFREENHTPITRIEKEIETTEYTLLKLV